EDARCLKQTHRVVGAHGSCLYFVTVRLNVVRELTQQTIQRVTFFVFDRGYRRTASCLGLNGNGSSQIIYRGLQSCLVKGRRRRNGFIGVNTLEDSARYSERL